MEYLGAVRKQLTPLPPTLHSSQAPYTLPGRKKNHDPFGEPWAWLPAPLEAGHQGVSVFLPTDVMASCLQSHPFYCWTGGETKLAKVPLTTAGLPCNPSRTFWKLAECEPAGYCKTAKKDVTVLCSTYSSTHLSCVIFSSFLFLFFFLFLETNSILLLCYSLKL